MFAVCSTNETVSSFVLRYLVDYRLILHRHLFFALTNEITYHFSGDWSVCCRCRSGTNPANNYLAHQTSQFDGCQSVLGAPPGYIGVANPGLAQPPAGIVRSVPRCLQKAGYANSVFHCANGASGSEPPRFATSPGNPNSTRRDRCRTARFVGRQYVRRQDWHSGGHHPIRSFREIRWYHRPGNWLCWWSRIQCWQGNTLVPARTELRPLWDENQ